MSNSMKKQGERKVDITFILLGILISILIIMVVFLELKDISLFDAILTFFCVGVLDLLCFFAFKSVNKKESR